MNECLINLNCYLQMSSSKKSLYKNYPFIKNYRFFFDFLLVPCYLMKWYRRTIKLQTQFVFEFFQSFIFLVLALFRNYRTTVLKAACVSMTALDLQKNLHVNLQVFPVASLAHSQCR